jgi:hypothetical protein
MADEGVLRIRVGSDLVLDAGIWRTEVDPDGEPVRIVSPPATPMFIQLIEYLETMPDPGDSEHITEGAVGLALLTVRWGSYYAALSRPELPLWGAARDQSISMIDDSEMRRINIEASAALAALIDIYREDNRRFWSLLRRAVAHLPATRRRARSSSDGTIRQYMGLATPQGRALLLEEREPGEVDAARAVVRNAPSRIMGNAFLNGCWRNGPIEDVHAGRVPTPRPLEQARISPKTDRTLFAAYSNALCDALRALYMLVELGSLEADPVETSLPFYATRALPGLFLIAAPPHWELFAQTAVVHLAGLEPGRGEQVRAAPALRGAGQRTGP